MESLFIKTRTVFQHILVHHCADYKKTFTGQLCIDFASGCVTDGGQGASRYPARLNIKAGHPLADILMFILLVFRSFFLRFSGCFRFFYLV